jgi:hypothetical protein
MLLILKALHLQSLLGFPTVLRRRMLLDLHGRIGLDAKETPCLRLLFEKLPQFREASFKPLTCANFPPNMWLATCYFRESQLHSAGCNIVIIPIALVRNDLISSPWMSLISKVFAPDNIMARDSNKSEAANRLQINRRLW